MTGLKSGSGDDLWGDDDRSGDASGNRSGGSSESGNSTASSDSTGSTPADADATPESTDGGAGTAADGASTDGDRSSSSAASPVADDEQPYIVRRAIRDKSVQFERDERLTFFVHDDVADGERELLSDVEAALGRGVPKFDLREAVYRAALRNPEDVLAELVRMGYTEE